MEGHETGLCEIFRGSVLMITLYHRAGVSPSCRSTFTGLYQRGSVVKYQISSQMPPVPSPDYQKPVQPYSLMKSSVNRQGFQSPDILSNGPQEVCTGGSVHGHQRFCKAHKSNLALRRDAENEVEALPEKSSASFHVHRPRQAC